MNFGITVYVAFTLNSCIAPIFWFDNIFWQLQIKSLLGTKVEWLYYILQAFNSGDLVRYQELCRVHNSALRAQPALVENEKKLLEKINILCLMEIIFRFVVHGGVFSQIIAIICYFTNLLCSLAADHLKIELYHWVSLQSVLNFLLRMWSIFLWRAFL